MVPLPVPPGLVSSNRHACAAPLGPFSGCLDHVSVRLHPSLPPSPSLQPGPRPSRRPPPPAVASSVARPAVGRGQRAGGRAGAPLRLGRRRPVLGAARCGVTGRRHVAASCSAMASHKHYATADCRRLVLLPLLVPELVLVLCGVLR